MSFRQEESTEVYHKSVDDEKNPGKTENSQSRLMPNSSQTVGNQREYYA